MKKMKEFQVLGIFGTKIAEKLSAIKQVSWTAKAAKYTGAIQVC